IIKNAQQFVQENLQPLNLYCYHAKFLNEYAKKLINTSKNVTNMEKVEKFDSSRQEKCNCPSDKNSRVHAEL
uniref:Glycosyl transferase CAP10 domain-containing protein n=1 Tax=Acrobeloides nanus TaxID=290746 RepID=A0A914DCJ6_9BILA